MEFYNVLGAGVVALVAGVIVLSVVGLAAIIVFWKTRKIIVPKITLLLVTGLEVPIKKLGRILSLEGSFIDKAVTNMRNTLNKRAYASVPYNMRVVFMPQCLRHPDCPARLSDEGIQCINCGRCGLGELKKEAEAEGIRFFIAPGSSIIKRMVAKYKPAAVLGVGCGMEVKEGSAEMNARGMPVQAVMLLRDGCVDTRADVRRIINAMFMTDGEGAHVISAERINGIEGMWSDSDLVNGKTVEDARHRYFDAEKKILDLRRI